MATTSAKKKPTKRTAARAKKTAAPAKKTAAPASKTAKQPAAAPGVEELFAAHRAAFDAERGRSQQPESEQLRAVARLRARLRDATAAAAAVAEITLPPERVTAGAEVASILARAGLTAEARASLDTAAREAAKISDPWRLVARTAALADACAALGERDRAEPLFAEAERVAAGERPERAHRAELSRALVAAGEMDRAAAVMARAGAPELHAYVTALLDHGHAGAAEAFLRGAANASTRVESRLAAALAAGLHRLGEHRRTLALLPELFPSLLLWEHEDRALAALTAAGDHDGARAALAARLERADLPLDHLAHWTARAAEADVAFARPWIDALAAKVKGAARPVSPAALQDLAEALVRAGRGAEIAALDGIANNAAKKASLRLGAYVAARAAGAAGASSAAEALAGATALLKGKLGPDVIEVWCRFAEAAMRAGDAALAADLFTRACAAAKGDQRAFLLWEILRRQIACGEVTSAQATLRELPRREQPSMVAPLVAACARRGHIAEAIEALRLAPTTDLGRAAAALGALEIVVEAQAGLLSSSW